MAHPGEPLWLRRKESSTQKAAELSVIYICPGCLRPLQPGDEYVVAREYEDAPSFGQLHKWVEGGVCRFHAQHFRRRIGDAAYRLIELEIV
jgi:hypothetical protein